MRTESHIVDIRPITKDDAEVVRKMLVQACGSTEVAGHGVLYDASTYLRRSG